MRINLYAEELPDGLSDSNFEIIEKTPANVPGVTFYGVRMYLKSAPELHIDPDDDDRTAITFWVPWTRAGGHRFTDLIDVLEALQARLISKRDELNSLRG